MEKQKTGNTKILDKSVQKARAARLKTIYSQKKKEHGLTQVRLAEMLNMKQSSVAKYLMGAIPLNYEAMVMFSKALGCSVYDIEPNDEYFERIFVEQPQLISVIGSLSGSIPTEILVEITSGNKSSVAIAIDQDTPFQFGAPKYAVLVPGFIPTQNLYAVRMKKGDGGFLLCKMAENGLDYLTGEKFRILFQDSTPPTCLLRDELSFIAPVHQFLY
ncbi:hypothetical protein GCM10023116_25020 [Kistimonas scapharcae]|uniref:HTH cro/C1-type domain-containing protein n=1 Tax=Kistimonas scapharcae TaxID=1036133 RepID=A0ABP8V493_9GAMM